MANGSNINMLTLEETLQTLPNRSIEDTSQSELERILQEQRNQQFISREKDLNIYRSGSAPPTVEGSLSAVGSILRNSDFGVINSGCSSNNRLLTEDEIRSHPAYLSYYYSHVNINPRLPPPLMSKEDWRVAQRLQVGGSSLEGFGDGRKKLASNGDSSSLFSMQPRISVQQAENDLMELRKASAHNLSRRDSAQWLDKHTDGLARMSGTGLGVRRKSFADILQEGLDQSASLSVNMSRPASHNAFVDILDSTGVGNHHTTGLCNGVESMEGLHSAAATPGLVGIQNPDVTVSHSFASTLGTSQSRSATPEQQAIGWPLGSALPPVSSKVCSVEKNAVDLIARNDYSSNMNELANMMSSFSGINFSNARHVEHDGLLKSQRKLEDDYRPNVLLSTHNIDKNLIDLSKKNEIVANLSMMSANEQVNLMKRTASSACLRPKMHSTGFGSSEVSSGHQNSASLPNMDFVGHVPGTFLANSRLNVHNNHLDTALRGRGNGQSLYTLGNRVGPDLHSTTSDPLFVQSLLQSSDYLVHGMNAPADSSQVRTFSNTSHGDLGGLQKAYFGTLLTQQKQHCELLGKSGLINYGYSGNQLYGVDLPYSGKRVANSLVSPLGSGNPLFENELISRINSTMRSSKTGSVGPWDSDIGNNIEGRFPPSLLDEFKNNKARSFELSDIVDHVVQFSTDQYGSRFIQQKLETASVEEKAKIFPKIIPHARTLMIDVFGNYVIQKFFEHGTESQRKELANQLTGHVLPLSLQMYGCRVIQKALEVVDVDQQAQMVSELDGAVMKCVRDQNGNHVIQKCIECVPQDRIQFIVSSFYGQVIALSTHPYGCRVIQRVLEYYDDPKMQQIVMDEIMQCVCTLAQDQYGNYVIQHVLEHGKSHERSAIICKLAGQIVKMSQQKFASNVVEKCLAFGSPEERQILVDEMLGTSDENEPLQAMMKDPFGNYVVQKVLETCDDQSLELILSRIKVHLNALKRYTYGKHIVSRIEKLITTGGKECRDFFLIQN